MKLCNPFSACLVAALAVALPARADKVASPEEVRALRAQLAKSPPKPSDYAALPYPGATFDADCSANQTAPRQPDGAVYCFYSRDPIDKVRAHVKGQGKPRNGVMATVDESQVSVDGIVKIDKVSRITYWTNRSTMAYHEAFPTSPPPAADLIAPLYPGATYDKECSAARSLEAKGNPKWRQVWCFVANEPRTTVGKAFDLELISTSKRGVKVDLVERSLTPPVTQIEYWLTAAPAPAPQAQSPATQPTQQSAASPAATTPAAPATASAPTSAAPNPSAQTIETVNKLRGLLGR